MKEREIAISIPEILPDTPKIGDSVEMLFIRSSYNFSTDDKYNSGYVHGVRDIIKVTTQEKLIFICPYRSIYNKWEEMKMEYLESKPWLSLWIKMQNPFAF